MPPGSKLPNAPRSAFTPHTYSDIGVSSPVFSVPGTVGFPPVPQAADFYLATEPRHLPLSTAAFATAGSTAFHMLARLDPYLVRTIPSDVRDFCNTVVWNKRQNSNIESHVVPLFQTAARELSQLAPRPGRSLCHRAIWPHAISEVANPCRKYAHLLHRGNSIEDTRFVSIPAETDLYVQSFIGREHAKVDQWTQVSKLM